MKILVTGCNGQVGWELARTLLPLGEVVAANRQQLDLADPDRLRAGIRRIAPDVIVNAAAYTAVDKAEQEPELAQAINAAAPEVMANELKAGSGLLVHYSTDYVFDGTLDRPYHESDAANPANSYGRSKLAGEQAISRCGADYLILRTSWVYASRGQNFMKTMLRLAAEREQLRIVADQTGAPTWARLIAETTAHVVKQALREKQDGEFASDLYHLTAGGSTSWHGFAEAIVELARELEVAPVKTRQIEPIATAEYPLPAKRPSNSCLATAKLERKYALKMPHWRDALALCMEEL